MQLMKKVFALLMVLAVLLTAFALAEGVTTPSDITTPSDMPTTEPSDEPTDPLPPSAEPTEAPTATKAPAMGGNSGVTATAEPVEEEIVDPIVAAFQASDLLATLEGVKVEVAEDGTITLTIPASADGVYLGGVLTIYPAGAREDGVLISLANAYNEETLATFVEWLKSITDAEALTTTESFKEFVTLIRTLVKAELPEMSEEEIDALLVELFQNSYEGELEALNLGEDVKGDVLSVKEQDGIEFVLLLTESEIVVLVREAPEANG